jgi:hypothetical protein
MKIYVIIGKGVLFLMFQLTHFSAVGRGRALLPARSNGKQEAATAVDELLMMGMKIPETC